MLLQPEGLSMKLSALALTLVFSLATTAARADSTITMNGTYQKVGSAGSSVDVQNTSSTPVQLITAASQPAPTAAGQVLVGGDQRCWALTVDLYALGPAPGQVAVTTGLSCGGGGGGGGGSVSGTVTANQGSASTTPWPVSWTNQSVSVTGSVAVTGTFFQATQPVSIANGADTSEGSTTDQPLSSTTATGTVQSVLRGLWATQQSLLASAQSATPSPVNTVASGYSASGKAAIVSTFTTTGQSSSFTPLAGRSFNVSLWGTFTAGVQLERSFDSGTTWLPITAAGTQLYKWTGPASEADQEDEVGPIYRLNCTAFTSGTVNYRISQ